MPIRSRPKLWNPQQSDFTGLARGIRVVFLIGLTLVMSCQSAQKVVGPFDLLNKARAPL